VRGFAFSVVGVYKSVISENHLWHGVAPGSPDSRLNTGFLPGEESTVAIPAVAVAS